MAAFGASVLTQKGLNLIAKAQAGQAAIKFTKAAAGDGTYADGESLAGLTELKSKVQEMPINEVLVVNENTVYLKFVISNMTDYLQLDRGYYVKEIGIYAQDPDEGEILYAVAVAVNEQWDYMPAYNGLHAATILMEFYTEVCNASCVQIVSAQGIYALQEDFDQLRQAFEALISLDGIVESYKKVFSAEVPEDNSMSSEDIAESIAYSWNGESTVSTDAMTAVEVNESIAYPWNGESSDSPTAMNKDEVAEAIQ